MFSKIENRYLLKAIIMFKYIKKIFKNTSVLSQVNLDKKTTNFVKNLTPIKLFIISGSIFLSILVICFIVLANSDQTFMGTFFSEVFGFALDGFIIVACFSFMQLWLDERRKEEEKKKLKNSLRGLAGSFIASCQLIAIQHGADIKDNVFFNFSHATLEDLIRKIDGLKINKNSDSVIELVSYVKSHKTQLESALPIAAQIDVFALHSWSAFLTHINIINSNTDFNSAPVFNALESLRWLGE